MLAEVISTRSTEPRLTMACGHTKIVAVALLRFGLRVCHRGWHGAHTLLPAIGIVYIFAFFAANNIASFFAINNILLE